MKRAFLPIIAALILAASAAAQAPPTKIGWIDTSMFADEKAGIVRYVTAIKAVDGGFKTQVTELEGLQSRIRTIAEELQKTPANLADPAAVQAKREEGGRLQREFEFKKKEFDAAYGKKRNAVIGPISGDIVKGIQEFAKQKGYAVILDISSLAQTNAVLHLDAGADLTKDFVAFFNARPAAPAPR